MANEPAGTEGPAMPAPPADSTPIARMRPAMVVMYGVMKVPGASNTSHNASGTAACAGDCVPMAATARLVPLPQRGLASGIVNAGGSFGQFVMGPMAIRLAAALGWASAMLFSPAI